MGNIPPEVQKQLEEQKKDCPFCKIIKGEIESTKVYEDDLLFGILDINPKVKGHMLLMPKEHYPILPFLPAETFQHCFKIMPKMVEGIKEALLTPGMNVMIANGGVAGQQSPHFLIHILPRESGDNYDLFGFDKAKADKKKVKDANQLLKQNVPIMMNNQFQRAPVSWKTGKIVTGKHLTDIKKNNEVIYEDEKVLVISSPTPLAEGHVIIYSQDEANDYEKLDKDSGLHMFSVASFCATAVYEGLKAAGSNIVLKTGKSNDNPDGRACIHVLSRNENDGIDILGEVLEPKPELEGIAASIKDKMFVIEQGGKEDNKPVVVNLDEEKPEVLTEKSVDEVQKEFDNAEDEIKKALDELKDL
jgi:histidine triad (HIT) family protein